MLIHITIHNTSTFHILMFQISCNIQQIISITKRLILPQSTLASSLTPIFPFGILFLNIDFSLFYSCSAHCTAVSFWYWQFSFSDWIEMPLNLGYGFVDLISIFDVFAVLPCIHAIKLLRNFALFFVKCLLFRRER